MLFLDELPEFQRDALEALRQPLEDGEVLIARVKARLRFPARFALLAAMNPCRCGHLGDPRHDCRCTPHEIEHYRARVSGPLLDRIDMHVEVPAVTLGALKGAARRAQRRRRGPRPGRPRAAALPARPERGRPSRRGRRRAGTPRSTRR